MEKKREKKQAREESLKQKTAPKPHIKNTETSKNIFAYLEDDDESEVETNVVLEETKEVEKADTYASILSKPRAEPMKQELIKQEPIKQEEKKSTIFQSQPQNYQIRQTFKFAMKSWADWSDSEDDEDLVKPTMKRQSSIMNAEEYYEDDENMPIEPPKLVRQEAQYGGGIHTSRLIDDEDW